MIPETIEATVELEPPSPEIQIMEDYRQAWLALDPTQANHRVENGTTLKRKRVPSC